MEFVTLLFGNRPPLTPEQEYYHRLLAGDAETAAGILEKGAEDGSGLRIIDEVVMPALTIGARDLRHHRISMERGEELADTIREAADTFSGEAHEEDPESFVIPGYGPIDTAGGELVARILARQLGIACVALHASTGLLALSSLKAEDKTEPKTLILFSVGGLSPRSDEAHGAAARIPCFRRRA